VRLWRISDFADLSGEGGLRGAARWHSLGRRIVYLVDHPASALVEVLVHLEIDVEDLPADYQLLAVDVPDDAVSDTVRIADLPVDWRRNLSVTRARGDRWLAERRTALLRVPSAVTPFTWNWLLNPLHADVDRARIAETVRVPFDLRLFG
jgi:RES domain-containing protein